MVQVSPPSYCFSAAMSCSSLCSFHSISNLLGGRSVGSHPSSRYFSAKPPSGQRRSLLRIERYAFQVEGFQWRLDDMLNFL